MFLALCIFLILIDQATKYYIATFLAIGTSIPVLPDIFHITYICNPGAAFGILPNQQMIFIAFAVFLLCAFIYHYKKLMRENNFIRYGAFMLLGGAMGNLIDRLRLGYVIDFFDFRIWPVFNVADIAVVCGVSLLMYAVVFEMKDSEDNE